MSLHADIIWEYRPTLGNNNNGGGFKENATGTDYSQQSAPQVSYTDLAIDAVDSTKITSAANPFSASAVGNIINVTGGAGFTTGRYEVTAVVGNVATLDRAVGTISSTGGTGNLGGALDSITNNWLNNDLRADGLNVHRTYIKNTGTMTVGGALAAVNRQGSDIRPLPFEGYNATRGDNPTGTNRPLVSLGVNDWTGDQNCYRWAIRNLRFSSSSTNGMCTGLFSTVRNCKFSSTGGSGKYACISGTPGNAPQSGVTFTDCEFTNPGGNGLGLGTSSYVSGYTTLMGCWIHDCLQGVTRQGSNVHNVYMFDCLVQNCTSSGVTGTAVTYKVVKNCTFYGAQTPAGTGINQQGTGSACLWINNIICGWTIGISVGSQCEINTSDYNNFYNTTTNRSNVSVGPHDTALDPQFTAVGSNDFSVGFNMKAIGAPSLVTGSGTTSYVDVGVAQRQEPGADYPTVGNVRNGIVYNNGGSIGTLALPVPTDVRNTVQYGAGGNEFTGSYVPAPLVTPSPGAVNFDSKLLDDAKLAFLNSSEFAEVITYTPYGGSAKFINAIVVRERLESKGPDHSISITRGSEIFIANDAVTGMTSINKNNDKVSFPVQVGGTPVLWTVVEILQHDDAMWHLRVIK